MKRCLVLFVFSLWVIGFLRIPVATVYAATIMVSTTNDELNSDGDCSLREAIQAANTNIAVDACVAGKNATTDVITLANGATYTMLISGLDEDANMTGDFDLLDNAAALDVSIGVAGGGFATVDANTLDRAFEVSQTTSANLSNLIIRNGSSILQTGGAIQVYPGAGPVSLINMTFDNNTATSGGAVYVGIYTTLTTITNCIFTNNSVTYHGAGGALETNAPFVITQSTFTNNSGGHGAAIRIQNSSIPNIIRTSSFVNNTSQSHGGAIRVNSGTLTISQSTFSGNSALRGGAIYISQETATLNIENSTFSGNSSSMSGKAIQMDVTTLNSTLTNVTVTNNTGTGADLEVTSNSLIVARSIINGTCAGSITDNSNNLAYPAACGGIAAGSDPLLLPLANNGGSTQTHLLDVGSPALDAYSTGCPSVDQRGFARPQGTNCDIGAVEMESGAVSTTTFTPNPSPTLCISTATTPSLISPVHRSHSTTTTPSFTWSSVSGAQSYRLMIYREDRSFEYKKRIFVPSYTLTTGEALVPAKYLWRVRTQDTLCGTWTGWSQRNTLFVD